MTKAKQIALLEDAMGAVEDAKSALRDLIDCESAKQMLNKAYEMLEEKCKAREEGADEDTSEDE